MLIYVEIYKNMVFGEANGKNIASLLDSNREKYLKPLLGIKDVIPRQLGLFPNLQDRNMKKLQKKYPGLERSYSH